MTSIDRNTPVPAYYQLKQLLKEQILSGELPPGDQIPTEEVLCARYNLSRTPVRQALKELVVEGLLTRTAGRGTFVTQPEASDESSVTTIRVVVSDERWCEPLQQATIRWNELHPHESMELDFTMMPLHGLRSYLIEAVGSGQAPDISLLDSVWVAEFANRHYLRSLCEIDPDWIAKHEGDFSPALLAGNQYNNTLYSVPITADMTVIWYRRDWLTAEGLVPPTTWEELVAVGRHFRHPSVRTRYGLGAHPLVLVGGRHGGETTTYQLLPFLWSAGGDLIHDNQVVLDSPGTQQALAFLTSLVQTEELASPRVVNYAWDESARTFARGDAALAVGGTYESFFIRSLAKWDEATFQEKVGFVSIPAPSGRSTATLVGGMCYVIYRQSRLPTEALALLDIAIQDEILGPFSLRTTHHPPRITTANKLAQTENGFLAQAASLSTIARARPSIPDFANVSLQFQDLVENCMAGRWSVEQSVSRTAEIIAAITGLPLKSS